MDKQHGIELIQKSSLARYADLVIDSLLPSARILLDGPKSDLVLHNVLQSHFGGVPSLPPDQQWPLWDNRNYLEGQILRFREMLRKAPRATGLADVITRMQDEVKQSPNPLPFLCQIALSQLACSVPVSTLPSSGVLLFFCDASCWGYDPSSRGHTRVLYFPEGAELKPTLPPSTLPESARFPHRNLRFAAEWTLPTSTIAGIDEWTYEDTDELRNLSRELAARDDDGGCDHRIGGHPKAIQGDMQLECQLVANGLYCGDQTGYQDPRAQSLAPGAADWKLLLQIDSDEEELGWNWGDDGRVYFWGREREILQRDFENAWAILQCY